LKREVRNIKEGVPFEPDIDKGRLHSGEHPVDAALVNASNQAHIGVAFEIHFYQLTVFAHGDLRLVWRR